MVTIFTQRLRQAMDSANMSQLELAQRSGFSKASICQYVNGANTPTAARMRLLADALGVDMDFLRGVEREAIPMMKINREMAARCMGISVKAFTDAALNGEYDFCRVCRFSTKNSFYISAPKLRQYVGADWFDQFFGGRTEKTA